MTLTWVVMLCGRGTLHTNVHAIFLEKEAK